jgi:hypothetical protein
VPQPVVNGADLCRVHDPAQAESVAAMHRNGGRRRAENFHAAMQQWVEGKQRDIVRVYEEALAANKIAVDPSARQRPWTPGA